MTKLVICLVVLGLALPLEAGSAVIRPLRIDHVVDGDTVDLTNGATVRLVQIDTPEVYFAGVLRPAGVGDHEAPAPAGTPSGSRPSRRPTASTATAGCSAT